MCGEPARELDQVRADLDADERARRDRTRGDHAELARARTDIEDAHAGLWREEMRGLACDGDRREVQRGLHLHPRRKLKVEDVVFVVHV